MVIRDWRQKENRKEGFIRYAVAMIEAGDCDPSLWMFNYLFKRFEHNTEQRLWISWLYGTTYYAPTTWVIWNEMPDAELVNQETLQLWNNVNYKRLRYQTDTKYNKGHLPAQFESYKEWFTKRGPTQQACLTRYIGDNEYQTFTNAYDAVVSDLHKFGRYTAWFYLQTLKHTCGYPCTPRTLLLNDYGGSRSHRNGLCFALGKDEWIDVRLTPGEIIWLEDEAEELLAIIKERVSESKTHEVDNYALETILCAYKKLFRERDSRFVGYYLDRQAREIATVEADGWNGICWRPLWQARDETLGFELSNFRAINPSNPFLQSGVLPDWKNVNPSSLSSFF